MWRVIKRMYEASRSAVLLDGERSASFSVAQGVAQGCSLSPILFSVFINDLLKEVEKAELGIQLECGKIGGMLFADDFVGVSDSKEQLQKLIDVVYSYCSKWRLKANVTKSAVMVFSKEVVEGSWKWGEHHLPTVTEYTYLGVDFASNGAWDGRIIKNVLDSGRKKVNQLHSVISNKDINMSARRLLLLSVVRPSLEYGNEVWEGNKSQAAALESVLLGGGKRILGCSSKTCNEAVRGDLGIDTLQGRRDKAKLKWWYKLVTMPEDRYPKMLFSQDWNIKPRRGRQRKVWSRLVDDLFVALTKPIG